MINRPEYYDDMQVPAPTDRLEEGPSVPDSSAVQLTVESFNELLEHVDVYEVFEEFIIPTKPSSQAPK